MEQKFKKMDRKERQKMETKERTNVLVFVSLHGSLFVRSGWSRAVLPMRRSVSGSPMGDHR